MFIKKHSQKRAVSNLQSGAKFVFILTIISFLFHFIVFIGRFAVAAIFDWYREGLYLFLLLPFEPDELHTVSEYLYLIFICLMTYATITQFVFHTLMLIVFTMISQSAFENNVEQTERTFSCLPQLSDLPTYQLPDTVTTSAQHPENADRHVQPAEDLSTTLNPHKRSEQIQRQENAQAASLISYSQRRGNLDSECIVDCHPNKHIVPIQQLENLAVPSEINNSFADHMEDEHQSITPEHSINIITEETTEQSDEHTDRIAEATLQACRTYYENTFEYVCTVDVLYHFTTGVSLILGTFVACVSLHTI